MILTLLYGIFLSRQEENPLKGQWIFWSKEESFCLQQSFVYRVICEELDKPKERKITAHTETAIKKYCQETRFLIS